MDEKKDVLTVRDLLYKLLEYSFLWNKPERKKEKPAMLRINQIEVLLDEFGLSKKYVNPLVQIKYFIVGDNKKLSRTQFLNQLSNLEYILGGHFLHDREAVLNSELSEKVKNVFSDLPESILEKPVDFSWLFSDLMRFRQEIYNITHPDEGMIEGFSLGLNYSRYLKSTIKKTIVENLEEIDNTLCSLLDPYNKTLNKKEINYLDYDLKEIVK